MKPLRHPVGALNNGIGGRIVGGSAAKRGEFPWQVSWRNLGSHSCGGSILNENWVLSAGHCCAGIIGSGDVVAGVIDIYLPEGVEQHKKITKFSHPDYDSSTINNDVCLLKVDEPFEFNDEIKPIAFDTNLEWAADSSFMVSGWGTKSSGGLIAEKLRKVTVPHVTTEVCSSDYASSGYTITEGMICAGEAGKILAKVTPAVQWLELTKMAKQFLLESLAGVLDALVKDIQESMPEWPILMIGFKKQLQITNCLSFF